MAARGSTIGRKQEAAIIALLTKRNIEEAAQAAGISLSTLLRWLKVPEFKEAYRDARRQVFRQSIARLQQATTAAAATLVKIMVDSNAPAAVRVRAADSVLNHATKAIMVEDIDERVSALEQTTKKGGSQSR